MTAADVTEAPWTGIVDGDLVHVIVADDDLQPTVCVIPPFDANRQRPLVERVEVAERIVADHRAARLRARPPEPDCNVDYARGVW